ncbi:MAG: copper-binding protein [Gemmatimonadota bacterium]
MRKIIILGFCVVTAGAALACETGEQPVPPIGDAAGTLPAPEDTVVESLQVPVPVTLDEWTIRLERDTLEAGTVTFAVANEGEYEHALEVEGQGNEWETAVIAPGGVSSLAADLEPGTYEVYCPVQDDHGAHQELGMRTTLVVR